MLQATQIAIILKQIFQTVTIPNMHTQIRENLSICSVPLLTINSQDKLVIISEILPIISSGILFTDRGISNASLQFASAFIAPLFEEPCLVKFMEILIPAIWPLTESNIKQLNSKDAKDLPTLEILEQCIKMIATLTDKLKCKNAPLLKIFADFPNFMSVMESLLKLSDPIDYYKTSIFSVSCNLQVNTYLNKIKWRTLCAVNDVFRYVYAYRLGEMSLANELITMAFNTLNWACVTQFESLDHLLNVREYTDIIVELLKLLQVTSKSHYQFFSANARKLIVDVMFPLLICTKEEKHIMVDNPDNFVNLSLDVCEKQESDTYKTQAAQLLENLCERIDGCLTFTAQMCTCIFKMVFVDKNFNTLSSNFAKMSDETLIETTLLVITDISYLTPKRKDIYEIFEKSFTEHFLSLFGTTSTLVKCRIAMMLGYYADNIYSTNSKMFGEAMKFLIVGMGNIKERAFALQCADALKNIINDTDIIKRVKHFINSLLEILCGIVINSDIPSFYEVLMAIVMSYSNSIDKTILTLLNQLIKRVLNESKNNITVSGAGM